MMGSAWTYARRVPFRCARPALCFAQVWAERYLPTSKLAKIGGIAKQYMEFELECGKPLSMLLGLFRAIW
jgi:hypothetical protein